MEQEAKRKRPEEKEKILIEDFKSFSDNFFKPSAFNLATISNAKNSRELRKILLSDFFFWFSAINVYLLVMCSATSALRKSLSMASFTFALPQLSSTSMVIFKCATVYRNKSNISEVFNKMSRVFPKEKKLQQKYNIRRYYKSYSRFARIYAFLFMVPCILVLTVPLIKMVTSGVATLPLNIWLPFDYDSNAVYVIAYLWTIWTCSNSVIFLIAIDTLMFVLISLVSMEFDILKIDLVNLKDLEASQAGIKTAQLVERHNVLINCGKTLERIFSPSFLYNFVLSSFVICLTAFQYTTSKDIFERIFNGSYCAAMLNQILLLCYFGQKVIDSSESIAGGAYDSGWEKIKNIKVTKALYMIIHRAQTPNKLTAMGFKEISLISFTTVKVI